MKNSEVVKSVKRLIESNENIKIKIMINGMLFEANHIDNINGTMVIAFDPDRG